MNSYKIKQNIQFTSDGTLIMPPLAFEDESELIEAKELDERAYDIYLILNKKLAEFMLKAEPTEKDADRLIDLFKEFLSEKSLAGKIEKEE